MQCGTTSISTGFICNISLYKFKALTRPYVRWRDVFQGNYHFCARKVHTQWNHHCLRVWLLHWWKWIASLYKCVCVNRTYSNHLYNKTTLLPPYLMDLKRYLIKFKFIARLKRCNIAIELNWNNVTVLDHIQSGPLPLSSKPCMHDILVGNSCISDLHDLSSYFMEQQYHIWSVWMSLHAQTLGLYPSGFTWNLISKQRTFKLNVDTYFHMYKYQKSM